MCRIKRKALGVSPAKGATVSIVTHAIVYRLRSQLANYTFAPCVEVPNLESDKIEPRYCLFPSTELLQIARSKARGSTVARRDQQGGPASCSGRGFALHCPLLWGSQVVVFEGETWKAERRERGVWTLGGSFEAEYLLVELPGVYFAVGGM